jgi:hypothetical protein
MMDDQKIIDNAPKETVTFCIYDYGSDAEDTYINCEEEFYDADDRQWVAMSLVDNLFNNFRSIADIKELVELRNEKAELEKVVDDLLNNSSFSVNFPFEHDELEKLRGK